LQPKKNLKVGLLKKIHLKRGFFQNVNPKPPKKRLSEILSQNPRFPSI
jgi:hypothetical protein